VGATKKYYHSFHRGVSESCIGPSEPLRDDTNDNDNVMSEFNNKYVDVHPAAFCVVREIICRRFVYMRVRKHSEKYADGHGILEFCTDKAGQDVTPMNLTFDDEALQTRGSTLNSISGELIPFCFDRCFRLVTFNCQL